MYKKKGYRRKIGNLLNLWNPLNLYFLDNRVPQLYYFHCDVVFCTYYVNLALPGQNYVSDWSVRNHEIEAAPGIKELAKGIWNMYPFQLKFWACLRLSNLNMRWKFQLKQIITFEDAAHKVVHSENTASPNYHILAIFTCILPMSHIMTRSFKTNYPIELKSSLRIQMG